MRLGSFEVGDLLAKLQGGSETINQAAEDTLSFGERWTLFKNKLETALVPLGVTLIGALSKLMEYSTPLIEMLSGAAQWFGQLPAPIQTAALGIAALAAAI